MNLKYLLKNSLPFIALVSALNGCSDDQNSDDSFIYEAEETYALNGALVFYDYNLNRFSVIKADTKTEPTTTQVAAGTNRIKTTTSADNRYLYSLSEGIVPRKSASDPRPELRIIDGKAKDARAVQVYQLDDPMTQLAIDPQGKWVAAYGGNSAFSNPNEIVLVQLPDDSDDSETSDDAVKNIAIRSFGGQPTELVFSDELTLPGNKKTRFLVVGTDRDISLIDLSDLTQPEITIPMPVKVDGTIAAPRGVAFSDGDPESDSDARLAVRMFDSPEVLLIQLNATDGDKPLINSVDVGATPSHISFVYTDGGLRLAALVPFLKQAALVNPETSITNIVDLPSGYENLSLVTDTLDETDEDSSDTALLWGGANSISFWSLSAAADTPYRSLTTTQLSFAVKEVLDVPAPSAHLKVLKGVDDEILILDLDKRESSPINDSFSGNTVHVSSNGKRLWITPDLGNSFAQLELADLHSTTLYSPEVVSRLHELNTKDGKRTLFTLLKNQDRVDLNIYDAESPDYLESYYFPALNLRDLP